MEFWKLNLRIGILEIKFARNWNFENYLKIGVLKIKYEFGVLEIKFERNWSFENKLRTGVLEIRILEIIWR